MLAIQKKQADTIISFSAPLACGFTIKSGGKIFVARLPDACFRRPSLLKKRAQLRSVCFDFRRAMRIPCQNLKRDQGSGQGVTQYDEPIMHINVWTMVENGEFCGI